MSLLKCAVWFCRFENTTMISCNWSGLEGSSSEDSLPADAHKWKMVCLGTAESSSPGFSYSAIYTAKIFICILAQANMIYLVTLGYLFAISIIESLRNEFAFQIPLRKCKNHFYHYLTWATYSRRPRWLFKSQFPKSGFCQLRFLAPKLLLVSTFSRLNSKSGNYHTSPIVMWPCQLHENSALAKCLTQKWCFSRVSPSR